MGNYTIFTSYLLVPNSGYTQAIHCNYIKGVEIVSTNIDAEEIRLNFSSVNDFKFLNGNIQSNGVGFTANKIYALIQKVSGITTTAKTIKPSGSSWYMYEVTDQVVGYTAGITLTPTHLLSTNFRVPLSGYGTLPKFIPYTLSYLNYPSKLPVDVEKLCFGDETYFIGNVTTDIHADVYPTDISITLPQNEFNSSPNNKTWDNNRDTVGITEVGIYDSNKNLVAIGKFNDPISKDHTVSRTISFVIDF